MFKISYNKNLTDVVKTLNNGDYRAKKKWIPTKYLTIFGRGGHFQQSETTRPHIRQTPHLWQQLIWLLKLLLCS